MVTINPVYHQLYSPQRTIVHNATFVPNRSCEPVTKNILILFCNDIHYSNILSLTTLVLQG